MKKVPKLVRRVLNLGLFVLTAALLGAALDSAVRSANIHADIDIVRDEAVGLYESFEKYYARHSVYPASYTQRPFDLETLDPLSNRGYYRGHLTAKLRDRRVDAYESPDDRGQNQEFWIEMTLALDPSIRILVVKSDDAPMGGGAWLDGVYLFRNGSLEQL